MNKTILTREIKNFLYSNCDMDLAGICPASALSGEPEGRRPADILPCAQSVIVYGKRLLNGAVQAAFRRLEDGNDNAESIYSTFGCELAPNFSMLFHTFNIANYVERSMGGTTQPLSCGPNQNGVPSNTELPLFAGPYKGGIPFNISHAAVAAGLGQLGWSNHVLTKEFGPRVRFGAILTDLVLDYDLPDTGPRLCDPQKCHICSEVCPTHALPSAEEQDAKSVTIAGTEYHVSNHKINACTVAALGLRNEFCGRRKTGNLVDSYDPTDQQIANAVKEKPFSNTDLDHYPKYYCDKCLLYCPVGNWKEIFHDTKLSKG